MPKNEIPDTIISQSMRMEGDLKSGGNIQVDGIVSGKIQTAQDLNIGMTAQIDADLLANNAIIAGNVRGNIIVKNSVTILETAKISGNITCGQIAIREGAFFSGVCQMKEKTEAKPISN